MKKLALVVALVGLAACSKDIPQNPPPTVVVANFNPGANPPVVPAPNDLAVNPATGLLNVTTGVTPADQEFEQYLNSLNGFPADTPATTSFNAAVNPSTITSDDVLIYDITGGASTATAVSGAALSYADVSATSHVLNIVPPGAAWLPGHTYMVALIGYSSGIQGAKGDPVVADLAWALLRSTNPLVTGCDPTAATPAGCQATTALIPSDLQDPAARLADQGATAQQLELLRLKYAPDLDFLDSQGHPRNTVALLWSFRIADHIVTPVFQLDPNPCNVHIPLPNDLAIDPTTHLLNAPANCPGQGPAEQEFTADYLDHLNGFPTAAEGSAQIVGGQLDPSTVILGPNNVVFADLTAAADPTGATPAAVPSAIRYDTTNGITFDPPNGTNGTTVGWPKGHQFAVALMPGIKGAQGEELIASDQFAFLRSTQPLVDCDLTNPATDPSTCHSAVTLAPISDAQAVQLEQIRLSLQPAFAALGVDPSQTAALWTFTIFSNPELSFNLALDPNQVVVPFPFSGRDLPTSLGDIFEWWIPPTDGGNGQTHMPASTPFADALNTQDGFSTTAPVVTSFGASFPRDLTDNANVDPASINPTTDAGTAFNVGLVNLSGTSTPVFNSCVNCGKASGFTLLPDGGQGVAAAEPELLQIVPTVPLDEQTTYAGFVTITLADTAGVTVAPASAFSLMRMKNPIIDPATNLPSIPAIAAAAAAGQLGPCQSYPTNCQAVSLLRILETVRQAYQGMFDTLDADGYPRSSLALAWDFHTMSTWSQLNALHTVPSNPLIAAAIPPAPNFVAPAPAALLGALPAQLKTNINKAFVGSVNTPFLLRQGASRPAPGTYGPIDLSNPTPQAMPIIVYEPTGTPPASGWPVAIFGHGLTSSSVSSVLLANAVNAAGYALLAYDEPFHGDRSFCVGSALATGAPSDDASCAAPTGTATCDESPTSASYGRCVAASRTVACDAASLPANTPADAFCQAQNLGNCTNDGTGLTCEGAHLATDANGTALISGWNFIDLPGLPSYFFLSTRDHFRQAVVDEAQLESMLALPAATTGSLNFFLAAEGGDALDGSNVAYVGQSLGGILGTLETSASPLVGHTVLNVAGGDLTLLLSSSPGLAPLRTGLQTALSAQNVNVGDPSYDQFINFAQWVMDPADPVNAAGNLVNTITPSPANRAVLVQWIDQDQVVVNPTTAKLLASANRDPANLLAADTEYSPSVADVPLAQRHGFLLNGYTASAPATEVPVTTAAQTEAATWIATGTK
ncbi:MAG: hypothetical protein JST54_27295 [Deltaproteobacteria bacterium]|nr:hypothetical protein [Deltaproteobacteria bacterium]